jgi:hypothetical protein
MEDSGSKAGRTRRPAAKTPAAAAGKSAAPVKAPAVRRAAAPKASTTPKATSTPKAPAAPRVPAASAAPVDRDEMVRVAAYFRALRRGFAPGYEVADWLEAQAEVDEILGAAVAPKSGKAPAKKRSAD